MKKENNKLIKEFPKSIKLLHEEIKTSPKLYLPVGILILDSVVLTLDLKADTLFQAFDLLTFENLGGFINRGHGPNEEYFVDPYIQPLPNNQFMFRNSTSIIFLRFNTETDSIEYIDDIKLPEEIFDLAHFFKLSKKIIGFKSNSPTTKEFVSYDIVNNEIKDFGGDYPIINKNIKITPIDKSRIFAKISTVKPDGKAFASVHDKFPILRIYSNTGELKKDIRLHNNQSFPYALIDKEPSISEINNIMQNYRMVKSTNNFIYALYIGEKNKNLEPGLNDFSNIVHVWDWDGNPIMRLILDRKIFTFDVDKNDDYLICTSLEKLNALYKYTINIQL